MEQSCVYLIGAGPGDPGLLTVKAFDCIKRADVVVYDRLVSQEIMDLVPAGTARIFVGKRTGSHPIPQDEINELLVRLARGGRTIVRLKGGDPFMFGRGAEEAQYLVRHAVRFVVVPGVTSAIACAAYAGIPLTHRDFAHGVIFVTGHGEPARLFDATREWTYDPTSTLVIYMGLAHLEHIIEILLSRGLPVSTPVAFIEWGTTPRQRRVLSTAQRAVSDAAAAALRPPTIIVVGDVVRLANTLDWFIPSATSAEKRVDATQPSVA